MDKVKFNKLMKLAELNKKQLASILKAPYSTVNAWGSTNNYPYWVETWLNNYIKAKNYNDVKDTVFEIEGIEKG